MSKTQYKKTDPRIVSLVEDLKSISRENDAPIWREIAKRMQGPKRGYATVNVSRINRHTTDGETIVVHGKVLGAGELNHPVAVGAFDFSDGARSKITDAGGECLTIEELVVRAPKGSNVRIIR
ncbi:MAG: 50S ribosomal protein L18e [Euryarchaeota archaeon]|nr:50S ribosomal protein L18e [Euryarchaeota archaeon]